MGTRRSIPKDWQYTEWHSYALQLPVKWDLVVKADQVSYRARTNEFMPPTKLFNLSHAPQIRLSERKNSLYSTYKLYHKLMIRDNPNK